MTYHRSLQRQVNRALTEHKELLEHPAIIKLLTAINTSYIQNDQDRKLVDRSIQLTSQELNERYEEIDQRLKQTAESHRQLEELISIINSTLEASLDGILLMDENNQTMMLNQRAADLLCTSKKTLENSNLKELTQLIDNVATNAEAFKKLLDSIEQSPNSNTSCTLEMRNGSSVDIYSQPRIQNNTVVGRVWNLHDITELRKNAETIRHRAYHDALTNLPNRSLFRDRIEHALSRYKRSKETLALLFIDLDNFKYINDTLGHEAGDNILTQVALRLNQVVREHDTIARHGGDEFLILLEQVQNHAKIKEISRRILKTISNVFILDDQEIYISASIGISIAPKDGEAPETLIRNADMAMYQAKAQGRNNFQFFKPWMADHSSLQLSLKNQLHQALQNNEFLLYYQPKVELSNGKITGAEALLRWQKDQSTIVGPTEFIHVAEQSGLILPISEWVFKTACAQLAQWLPKLSDDFVLSINMSAQHFKQPLLVQSIINTLEHYQIPSHRIELELTESVVIEDPKNSIDKLQTLREHGINLSIDDFGTGYSSFNYLKTLPISIIKIDRSFIKDIEESDRDLLLVQSIVNIAHTLNFKVVAEGVETQKSRDLLRQIKCDMAQGYFYDKPLEAERFEHYLI